MKKSQILSAGLISIALFPTIGIGAEAATFTKNIDTFNFGNYFEEIQASNPIVLPKLAPTATQTGVPQVLGGNRTIDFQLTAATRTRDRSSLSIDGIPPDGSPNLVLSNDNNNKSIAKVAYPFPSAQNFSAYQELVYAVESADQGGLITVSLTTSAGVQTLTQQISAGPGEKTFDISAVPGLGSVSSFFFTVTSNNTAFDITIDSLFLRGSTSNVPEPATMLGAAIAMGAGFMTTKKGNKKTRK